MIIRTIDKDNWKRKEHFEFFNDFDEPFFGLVSEVDCSKAFKYCKANGISFFSYYMYHSLYAANEIEEFKYRINNNNEVDVYDAVHSGSTIGRPDGTFAFSFAPFSKDYDTFAQGLSAEIDRVQHSTGLRFNDEAKRMDLIHYSTLPWHQFSGFTHARNFKFKDSTPKITFGKAHQADGTMKLPVSVNVNHALMDGYHVGKYYQLFQELLNTH